MAPSIYCIGSCYVLRVDSWFLLRHFLTNPIPIFNNMSSVPEYFLKVLCYLAHFLFILRFKVELERNHSKNSAGTFDFNMAYKAQKMLFKYIYKIIIFLNLCIEATFLHLYYGFILVCLNFNYNKQKTS